VSQNANRDVLARFPNRRAEIKRDIRTYLQKRRTQTLRFYLWNCGRHVGAKPIEFCDANSPTQSFGTSFGTACCIWSVISSILNANQ